MRRFGCAGLLLLCLASCAGNRQTISQQEQIIEMGEGDIRVDAYLFDCRLKRNGKLNSFRLDLFVTDSMAAFYGRGYLGKGVFRGVLRNDSLYVLFPTTHEYLMEAVPTLLHSGDCAPDLDEEMLLTYLLPIADSRVKETGKKTHEITLDETADNCAFHLHFSYKEKDDLWRPEGLEFSDLSTTELTATRRELRIGAKISRNRFDFVVPENSARISP